jgi:mannan endo-1,4-beta-mannosidase
MKVALFTAGRHALLALAAGALLPGSVRAEVAAAPPAVPAALADAQATPAARDLQSRLAGGYGRETWSGLCYETNDLAHVYAASGRQPAIVAGDFMDYSPSRVAFGGRPKDGTESMIALSRAGYVITMCWHWNAPTNLINSRAQPWWRGFYTEATTFDVAKALAHTNSAEYALLLRDMDAIAVQLKKFSDADVPVLWRPLHEAEGGWFWWGARGPKPFKALWRLLYQRLTDEHHLHNLVWVFAGEKPDWYPGDDVVDVIGVDAYPKDPGDLLAPRWQGLQKRFKGRKLIALTEFGGVPDIPRMQAAGVWWAYFASWYGTVKTVPDATIARVFRAPTVVTLERIQIQKEQERQTNRQDKVRKGELYLLNSIEYDCRLSPFFACSPAEGSLP